MITIVIVIGKLKLCIEFESGTSPLETENKKKKKKSVLIKRPYVYD